MDDDTRWPVVDDRGEAGLGTSLEREAEAAVTPTPVHPTFWPRAELLARVRGGRRRFPAHHVIEQVSYPPNWWWFAESSRAGAVEPDWYAPRYAQRRRSAS